MKHLLTHFRYRGARAMVLMHETELRGFVAVWREAQHTGIKTEGYGEDDRAAYLWIMHHVLSAARSYLIWLCAKLELPDPAIDPTPAVNEIELHLDRYLEHLLARWRLPLSGTDESCFDTVHKSNWNIDYCLEAMLEHAVMHPYRHRFQIAEWMEDMSPQSTRSTLG